MATKLAPLLVIVGETGSGKSELALKLAKQFNSEIICADSRTVYKGMDIGTAKPSKTDQKTTKHHLLDIVWPSQRFTVVDFKKLANEAIKDISNRAKLPILVGGTGLYVDSVIYDFKFNSSSERNPLNPRHRLKNSSPETELRDNTLVIGLKNNKQDLEKRLTNRVEAMVSNGLVDEVRTLMKKYPSDSKALEGTSYKSFKKYLDGELEIDEAKRLFVSYDLALAKRQRTWFKRNKSIHWVDNGDDVVVLVTTFLNK